MYHQWVASSTGTPPRSPPSTTFKYYQRRRVAQEGRVRGSIQALDVSHQRRDVSEGSMPTAGMSPPAPVRSGGAAREG